MHNVNYILHRAGSLHGLGEGGGSTDPDIAVIDPFKFEVDHIYNLACPVSPPHYQFNPIKTMKTSAMGAISCQGLAKRVRARLFQADVCLVQMIGEDEWLDTSLAQRQVEGVLAACLAAGGMLNVRVNATQWWIDKYLSPASIAVREGARGHFGIGTLLDRMQQSGQYMQRTVRGPHWRRH